MRSSSVFSMADEQYQNWLAQQNISNEALDDKTYLHQLHLRHRLSIGGTAASVIAGANPYRSVRALYEEMLGLNEPFEGNYVTRRGEALESLVAARAGEILHREILLPKFTRYLPDENKTEVIFKPIKEQGNEQAKVIKELLGYSFITAQLDSLAVEDNGALTIIECKTARRNATKKDGTKAWGIPLAFNDYGQVINGVDGEQAHIPEYYFSQVQWQLMLVKMMQRRALLNNLFNDTYAYVAVDIAGADDVAIYKVYADPNHQELLLQSASIFLTEHLFKQVPPVDYLTIDRPEPINPNEPNVLSAKRDFMDMLLEYKELDKEIKELSERHSDLKSSLEKSLGDKEEVILIDEHGSKVAEKRKVTTKRLDTAALRNENPEIYKQFLKTTTSYRVKF